jgi:hypothetical protein
MDTFALFLLTAMPVGTRASNIRDFAAIMVASPASRSALDPQFSESSAVFAAVQYLVGDGKRGQIVSFGNESDEASVRRTHNSRDVPRECCCMPHCMGAAACTPAVRSCQSGDKASAEDVFQSVAQLIPSRATGSLERGGSFANRAPSTRRRRYGSTHAAVHPRSNHAVLSGGGHSWWIRDRSSWVRPMGSAPAVPAVVVHAPVNADASVGRLPFLAWGG